MDLGFIISLLLALFAMAKGLVREYILYNYFKSWSEAQRYCRSTNMDLATITTEEEYQRVKSLQAFASPSWIGLNNMTSNTWQWSDGEPLSYVQWKPNMPDNFGLNENCVTTDYFGWNDYPCLFSQTFICYRRLILVKENLTWEEALVYCRTKYTDMLSLSSENQPSLVEKEAEEVRSGRVWIGLRFLNGNWFWINQDPLGQSMDLPTCPVRPYRCGARNLKAKAWEYRDCNEKLNFYCF